MMMMIMLIINEPVILRLPVNSCVSSNVSPNLVEPLEKEVVMYETDEDIINCCAVISPKTFKFPVIF